jgi:hypothetical protein
VREVRGESNEGVRGRLLEGLTKAIDGNKVIRDTFDVVLDTYTLAKGYKHTCELMHMI